MRAKRARRTCLYHLSRGYVLCTIQFNLYDAVQECKKRNETVPNAVKDGLLNAVKEPSQFIANFLKENDVKMKRTVENIFIILRERYTTDNESKKGKYQGKLITTLDNYEELTKDSLGKEWNEEDFLKNAFLQYMLYAYLGHGTDRIF